MKTLVWTSAIGGYILFGLEYQLKTLFVYLAFCRPEIIWSSEEEACGSGKESYISSTVSDGLNVGFTKFGWITPGSLNMTFVLSWTS